MAVKSSVLQSVATASYEAPLAKIKQSQMLLGGGLLLLHYFITITYLVWVGMGKEGNTITRLTETTQRFTVSHPEAWM